MQISAKGVENGRTGNGLHLTHEKPIQNQVIQLSWIAMILLMNPIFEYLVSISLYRKAKRY
jgi:hypothetical protein